jgi:hypothetical protein
MAKKIESLTPEQSAQVALYRDKWIKIGLATGPCDRPAMEAAVDKTYACAGLAAPKIKIWLSSPLEGIIGAYILSNFKDFFPADVLDNVLDNVSDNVSANVRANVWDNVSADVWDNVLDNVSANVSADVWDNVWANVRDNVLDNVSANVRANVRANVWDNVRDNVRANVRDNVRANVSDNISDNVRANVWDNVRDNVSDNVKDLLNHAGYGQHDSGWLSFYNFFLEVCDMECVKKLEGLNLLSGCGWWWPFKNAVILTERPSVLNLDNEGNLHCENGPALSYPDGFSVYAVNGVRLPDYVIMNPEKITVQDIDSEENTEIRRVKINQYGQAKYLLDSGAEKLHSDDFGILWRKLIGNDEPLVMVQVVNSTPEPDGSFNDYFLRCHPELRLLEFGKPVGQKQELTARNAVASLFGMRGQNYSPEIET